MNLKKDEQELLKFCQDSTMGVIRTYSAESSNVAYRLAQKGYLEKSKYETFFAGADIYWNLTDKGRNYSK